MLFNYLEFMRDEFELHLLYVGEKDIRRGRIPSYVKSAEVLDRPSYQETIGNFLRFGLNRSLQERLFFSGHILSRIREKIKEIRPDIVFFDMIRMGQYALSIPEWSPNSLKIIDLDDLLSLRYRRLSAKQVSGADLLGEFKFMVPTFFTGLLGSLATRTILRIESWLMRRRELESLRNFDMVLLVSKKEAEILKKMCADSVARVLHIPPAIREVRVPSAVNKHRHSMGFVGYLGYYPNLESFLYLKNEIFPEVRMFFKDASITVIGRVSDEMISKYGDEGGILFRGYVEDIEEALSEVEVFVAPIFSGTGIKTKILTAMAVGLPVVTTPLGVEGLDVRNMEEIVIAESRDQFIRAIRKIFEDRDFARELGRRASNYVRRFHDFDRIKTYFLEEIEKALREKQYGAKFRN